MSITELTMRVREEWEAPLKTRIIALETELAIAVSGYEDRIAALEADATSCATRYNASRQASLSRA